jgi:magnesium-transporting ATPase (P-type)
MFDKQGKTIMGYDLFAGLNSEQKAEVIKKISMQDEFVGMVGDRVSDLQAMRSASLGIAGKHSSQIVKQVADIVIIKDRPKVLSTVLHEGQRIVNGVMDMLKLNLTQVSYVLILLLVMYLVDQIVFFYDSAQNGVIYFVTVLLPSLSLSLFAPTRAVNHKDISWRLAHFIIPAGVTMSIAGLLVYTLVTMTGSELINIQLTVLHAMILMGLILVVFVQPPTQWWVGGAQLSGRWWPTILVVAEFVLFQLIVQIPLVQELLKIGPLEKTLDYVIVFGIAIVWLFTLRTIWRRRLINRGVVAVSRWLAGDQNRQSRP